MNPLLVRHRPTLVHAGRNLLDLRPGRAFRILIQHQSALGIDIHVNEGFGAPYFDVAATSRSSLSGIADSRPSAVFVVEEIEVPEWVVCLEIVQLGLCWRLIEIGRGCEGLRCEDQAKKNCVDCLHVGVLGRYWLCLM